MAESARNCCSNTLFNDPTGVRIRLDMSPLDVITQYPDSMLADLLKKAPIYHTETEFQRIYLIVATMPDKLLTLESLMSDTGVQEGDSNLATIFRYRGTTPSNIYIGEKMFEYADFMREFNKGLRNDAKKGIDPMDSVKRMVDKLGAGGPFIFQWGSGTGSYYNFVTRDNRIDCDALTHWSGSMGLLPCCQLNTPLPNSFGLEHYPADQKARNLRECEKMGLGYDKFNKMTEGGYKRRSKRRSKKVSKRRSKRVSKRRSKRRSKK